MHLHHIRNLAIAITMVCVMGCASQNKQSSPAAIQNPDIDIAFLRLIAAEDAKNPILPDEDLMASFQKHRTTFEQLQQPLRSSHRLDPTAI
jgi:outer membrane protein TolC